ncbi:sialidase/neuraminidase family protein [Pinibacter aurantiacus]|uniref:Exo-alpha-sialidase n=1 Tax=Pinibacter aurantiacus TaxID=2851599 RepID=A0A9E2SCA5_9BACT|nr:glycoside hydrolase [Pinibacter aurantiacus]MBV4359951.1 hypothetical protein [Pinibacter aurantiacus]
MKLRSLLTFAMLATCSSMFAQTKTNIEWKEKVLINDVPVFNDAGKVSEAGGTDGRHQGRYGSQYARLLKLTNGTWLAAYTVSRNNGYARDSTGGLELEVSKSNDNGKTWKPISVISDHGRDLDNAEMIQCKDGSLRMACRSVRWQESYLLPVYKSKDNGVSWTRVSIIDQNEGRPGELGKPDKGVYEPHMYFLDNGKLSVMYANEIHVTANPSYSQIISQKISDDNGATWGKEIWVAYEEGHNASRPGMPVWTKMKNGQFIVVYEVCGPQKCNIYFKISKDGVNWPTGLGTIIPDQLGGPYILALSNGSLVVTSNSSNYSISDDFGKTWRTIDQAWPKTLWASIYQLDKNTIGAVNSTFREGGGNNIQVRVGTIRN